MDDLYREQILEHHRRPHNQGSLTAPSVSLEGRNPNCGDVINLQLQLDDAGVITDVAFSGRGCAISQAGTSLITDELRGKRVGDKVMASEINLGDGVHLRSKVTHDFAVAKLVGTRRADPVATPAAAAGADKKAAAKPAAGGAGAPAAGAAKK
jgi:nitrogen fixation NifU-like protein